AGEIALELATALDDWALTRRRLRTTRGRDWRELLAIANAADPDEGRARLRRALGRLDARVLVEFATPEQVARLPASTQVLLAIALLDQRSGRRAVAVLRQARRQHPGDFWLNHYLGLQLLQLSSGKQEAVRFYTAAVAVRPHIPAAHVNLGFCLTQNGQWS